MSPAPLRISVVIANWNYAAFVGAAIDSALALDWPAVEVIVVDDGSTDDSRRVIEAYGDRVESIFQANGGQRAACNAGFARARGDVVIFLDADDRLDPTAAREIAAVWRPGISKVQFQMRVIDAAGEPTGAIFPHFPAAVPTPREIRSWALGAGAYPTPVGSGNAYARTFLEAIFPLEGSEPASDSYCLAAAPLLGDVVTIAKPLVSYRIHGRNDGAMSALDVTRFARELVRAQWRFAYAQAIGRRSGIAIADRVFRRSLATLPYRLASLRLDPQRHPMLGDSLPAVVADTIRAAFVPQGRTPLACAALVAWTVLVASLPQHAGARLALWRFASPSRPKALRWALAQLHNYQGATT
jgi:glycosyltransferase involved in cell wall biosynthesis